MVDKMVPLETRPFPTTLPAESRQLKSIANTARNPQNKAALADVCQKLEALFIHHLMKEMRATVDKSGLIDGGPGEEIFTSMLDNQMAIEASAAGGIGLAKILFEQLSQQLEKKQPETDPATQVKQRS